MRREVKCTELSEILVKNVFQATVRRINPETFSVSQFQIYFPIQ